MLRRPPHISTHAGVAMELFRANIIFWRVVVGRRAVRAGLRGDDDRLQGSHRPRQQRPPRPAETHPARAHREGLPQGFAQHLRQRSVSLVLMIDFFFAGSRR
jgi:hypothetical protein